MVRPLDADALQKDRHTPTFLFQGDSRPLLPVGGIRVDGVVEQIDDMDDVQMSAQLHSQARGHRERTLTCLPEVVPDDEARRSVAHSLTTSKPMAAAPMVTANVPKALPSAAP